MHDDWHPFEDDEEDGVPAARPGRPPSVANRVRRIAQAEDVAVWATFGVDLTDFSSKQEHARLLDWLRARKRSHEIGFNKAAASAITAVVSAAVGIGFSIAFPWWHHP